MKFNNLFKKEKTKEQNLSSNIYKIELYRLMSGVLREVETFEAIQDRDNVKNLILNNKDFDFKEDTAIEKADFINFLKDKFNLNRVQYETRLTRMQEKIKSQEDVINSFKDGYIIIDKNKIKANIIDERNLLKQYKILYESIKIEGGGTYETITKDGYIKIRFLLHEGILYPYFHKTPTYKNSQEILTMYPDISSKRKIYKSEQDIIDRDFLLENQTPFGNFWGKALWFIGFALIIIGVFWNYKNYEGMQDNEAQFSELREQILQCEQSQFSLLSRDTEILNYAKGVLLNESMKSKDITQTNQTYQKKVTVLT